jgi:DNA-binding NarL/FixJ family response regulator
LILTGLGYDQELLSEALQKGADGYVTKDLPMEELLDAVNRTLSA